MEEWKVEEPTVIDIDGPVGNLAVRLVAGHVDVVTTDNAESARVEVSEIENEPLIVTIEDGTLTIRHERLTWEGILGWLRPERRRAVVSVAVPSTCTTRVGVVTASAVVAGVDAPVTVRCVSGEVVLDEVTGPVEVESVSGDIEARRLEGTLTLKTVSGGLTVVDGRAGSVRAKTVSGDVALDLQPVERLDIDISTVSGDVTVRVPGDSGLRVDMASTSGDLACAFDGVHVEKKPGSRTLRGSIGDGSGAMHGRSVSGRVALLSR